jgi:hypothetical protein
MGAVPRVALMQRQKKTKKRKKTTEAFPKLQFWERYPEFA